MLRVRFALIVLFSLPAVALAQDELPFTSSPGVTRRWRRFIRSW